MIQKKNLKIILLSFKNIKAWNSQKLESKFNLRKFSVLKAPFKYNKSREQFCLRHFKNTFELFNYSPKIYEILFFKYLYLSNTKFFNLIKFEKNNKW